MIEQAFLPGIEGVGVNAAISLTDPDFDEQMAQGRAKAGLNS
jgi:hypothetical protein